MAVIYPQYAPPNPWKELQVKKANEEFRQVQLEETLRWNNVRIWYLLKGYWYSGWSKVTVGKEYSKIHPWTCVDLKYQFMDINNFGAPLWGETHGHSVYDGTNRVQLRSKFQPMKKYIGYWEVWAGPFIPFLCKVRYMIDGMFVLVDGDFKTLAQEPYRFE